ncbi:hypothetical protein BC835DRAFT_1529860 [Cytidiella melzeri]|nr:hypothetical protein BC835DRAFT_1529860 [Cytidiella melzeri]
MHFPLPAVLSATIVFGVFHALTASAILHSSQESVNVPSSDPDPNNMEGTTTSALTIRGLKPSYKTLSLSDQVTVNRRMQHQARGQGQRLSSRTDGKELKAILDNIRADLVAAMNRVAPSLIRDLTYLHTPVGQEQITAHHIWDSLNQIVHLQAVLLALAKNRPIPPFIPEQFPHPNSFQDSVNRKYKNIALRSARVNAALSSRFPTA